MKALVVFVVISAIANVGRRIFHQTASRFPPPLYTSCIGRSFLPGEVLKNSANADSVPLAPRSASLLVHRRARTIADFINRTPSHQSSGRCSTRRLLLEASAPILQSLQNHAASQPAHRGRKGIREWRLPAGRRLCTGRALKSCRCCSRSQSPGQRSQ